MALDLNPFSPPTGALIGLPHAAEIARQHDVDLAAVSPPDSLERKKMLRAVLDRTDVPFPIEPARAEAYWQLAVNDRPFRIGSLTDSTVDLAGFESEQVYDQLSLEDHLSWACLVADQRGTKHRYACREYLHGEELFEIGGFVIPDYYLLNARIYQQTGWQLAAVSEIIPAEVFFHCHSRRFFPVTTFMRPLGTDYLAEPDIGHDVAGHVATFTIPEVAQVMNNHGLANNLIHEEAEAAMANARTEKEREKIRANATELLLYAGRLYWFTVEFGLVQQENGLKVFGAGILSSPGETRFSVESPESNRVLINPADDRDLLRLATTDYLISEFQKTYFVMSDFAALTSLTPERILKTVHTAQRLPHHTWREIVPGDQVLNVGRGMTSPHEKYYRLLAGQPLDDCLRRAAIRNLRMTAAGCAVNDPESQSFLAALPPIPESLVAEFNRRDRLGEFPMELA